LFFICKSGVSVLLGLFVQEKFSQAACVDH
jgi:hypothetical protein